MTALGGQPTSKPVPETGKLRNPYSSLPVLEPIERILILSNREKQLKRAVDHLNTHRLLLVTGMPGIGKSTFARALLGFMPAGSSPPFWYNFERQRSSGNSLNVLLDHISSYLDVCLDADVRQEVLAFRSTEGKNPSVNDVDMLISFLNQEMPIWLVFDNLETVLSRDTYEFLDEGVELLFDSLKTNTHNAKIIITNPFVPILKTGELFMEAGASTLILEGLNDDFAFAFLRAFGLQDRTKEELEPLIHEINGHPFVLNHIARYMQAMGSGVILADLPGGLEVINERFGDFLKGRLSSQEFNALQSLTVLNRDMTVPGLCQIAQVRRDVIMHLREKGLLQANTADRFWLHNIVRNSLKPESADQARRAHWRAMNFYRNRERPLLAESIDDYASVLEWHHHAVGANDPISAYSALYSTGLKDQLMRWNEYELVIRLCEQIISAVYQVEANVSQVEANLSNMERINVYHSMGIACFELRDFVRSIPHLKAALNLLDAQEDKELRIQLLINLSESYNAALNFDSAIDLCRQIEVLLPNTRNETLHAKFFHLRGIIHRDHGESQQAIDDLEEALKLYKKTDDQIHIASILAELGVSYYYQNQLEKAVANYREAIILYEAVNYPRGIMIARSNIGDIMLQSEEYELAVKELQLAFDVGRRGKFGNLELAVGLGLVEAYIALSRLDEANKLLASLKPLLEKTTLTCYLAQELALLAYIQWKYKNYPKALDLFLRAFKLLKGPNCQHEYARANLVFAAFWKEQGESEKARVALILARDIFMEQKNQLGLRTSDRELAGLNS